MMPFTGTKRASTHCGGVADRLAEAKAAAADSDVLVAVLGELPGNQQMLEAVAATGNRLRSCWKTDAHSIFVATTLNPLIL